MRAKNAQLQARMDALERHQWRRVMRASVEDTESRAKIAEDELDD